MSNTINNNPRDPLKLLIDLLHLRVYDLDRNHKQPNIDIEEVQVINLNEEICENDDIMPLCIFDLLEMTLVTDVKFLAKFKLDYAIQFANYMNNTHCINVVGWIRRKSYLHI